MILGGGNAALCAAHAAREVGAEGEIKARAVTLATGGFEASADRPEFLLHVPDARA